MTGKKKYMTSLILLLLTGTVEFFVWFMIDGPGQGMLFLLTMLAFNIIIASVLNLIYFWQSKQKFVTFLLPGVLQIIAIFFYSENHLVFYLNIVIPLVNLTIGLYYFSHSRKAISPIDPTL
ncbi:hypothetical protein Q765_20775 [Flavobacterium rivuli WB 3.3-2 = DSM 21788]|uniref:Uncharacterized protein n=1 Tax=Flavobacterium rivuli WB 3.3-2 = DSM 21788 TaxID=1121895 RepID=A0A0A2M8I7_9FLAO|nr:hypothetical protein [Flavobacterium rivuli]KGO84595.1 hypothetical protein Q765_20775 [Flavobacterium rivuli WB 3.3-2 = DSM 21788]